MPVNLLLCEGAEKSWDIRVLSAIAPLGITSIRAVGSKNFLDVRVSTLRNEKPGTVIAALRDRDLELDLQSPIDQPVKWTRDNHSWLGWHGARVEIENYLLDPIVIKLSLQNRAPSEIGYKNALEQATLSLSDYTAARTALSQSRIQVRQNLNNKWGVERGKHKHLFPTLCTEAECRKQIAAAVLEREQRVGIDEPTVIARFEALLPECRPGGKRFQDSLTYFSGKDLLWAMEGSLQSLGLGSPISFIERIVTGIEAATDDVSTWLPEWSRLRLAITNVASNDGS